ncbi:unnamed protein product [Brugia timori]|uniref:Uncharacterized protein n=1 Tax=Brugia timori TaxID=42155 RepID=A0A0R3R257_9BILA|nr:unnamed protein product [Brugia timori]
MFDYENVKHFLFIIINYHHLTLLILYHTIHYHFYK